MTGYIISVILFLIFGILFGANFGKVLDILHECEPKKTFTLGVVTFLLGCAWMFSAVFMLNFSWKEKEYDFTEYEIVRDTIITNHNGQIDTTATFKISKISE